MTETVAWRMVVKVEGAFLLVSREMLSLFFGGLQELLVQVLHVVLLLSVGVFRNEPKLASEVFLHEHKKNEQNKYAFQ